MGSGSGVAGSGSIVDGERIIYLINRANSDDIIE